MQVPLLRLQCGCNSYEWGKPGHHSAAARYASATNFQVDEDKPYAELWMGTHPSLPSTDLQTGRTLLSMIQDNASLMTREIAQRYGNKLPFLFKVLSITKALSIQAHPNKRLAEQLHARDSKNYPDDNHKPEMTIALTPFDGLCGFRPLEQTAHFLRHVGPLRQLVGEEVADRFITTVTGHETTTDSSQTAKNKEALQAAFTSLMNNATSNSTLLVSASESLITTAQSTPETLTPSPSPIPETSTELSALLRRLHSQFPHDVGLFVLFFLNYMKLDAGEAMFLRADDIHAYLSGDIIECMASSDNVVRAGFTPKFKDVATLGSMLTYSYAPIADQKLHAADYPFVKLNAVAFQSESSSLLYDPPIEEFAVVKTDLRRPAAKATFEPVDGPSIVICTAGAGTIAVGPKREEVREGYVFFVGASAECAIEAGPGTEDGVMTTFRAFCELNDDGPTANGKM